MTCTDFLFLLDHRPSIFDCTVAERTAATSHIEQCPECLALVRRCAQGIAISTDEHEELERLLLKDLEDAEAE